MSAALLTSAVAAARYGCRQNGGRHPTATAGRRHRRLSHGHRRGAAAAARCGCVLRLENRRQAVEAAQQLLYPLPPPLQLQNT